MSDKETMMRPPKKQGDVSQSYFIARCLELGWTISVPVGDCDRYDAIIDRGRGLERVQIKTGRTQEGAVLFSTCSSTYHVPEGCRTKHMKHSYRGQIELFGVYCPQTRQCYLIGVNEVPEREARLRIDEPKNAQSLNIRWAKDWVV